ncbi:MAG: hypothetical protein V9G14_17695 [Cypionkella sp.]
MIVELEVLAERRAASPAAADASAAGSAGQPRAVADQRERAPQDRADHPLGRARRLVEVDLLEHEEPREQERLDGARAP